MSSLSTASSTIYSSILPTTTLLSISTVPLSTSSKLSGNGVAPANLTHPAAVIAPSYFSLASDASSHSHREFVVSLVLISVIVFFLLFIFTLYLLRRVQQLARKKQQELEEDRIEVTEARALWPMDKYFKDAYRATRRPQRMSAKMPQSPPPLEIMGVNRLYQPGMKHSRTLSITRPLPYSLSRPTNSSSLTVNGQKNITQSPTAPSSATLSLKPGTNPLSHFTIMQTRQPTTPEPLHPPMPIHRSTSPDPFTGRAIHSFWSISETSLAPSSPSLSFPTTPKFAEEIKSLRPRPKSGRRRYPTSSPYHTPSIETTSEDGECRMTSAVSRNDSPTLETLLMFRFSHDSVVSISPPPERPCPTPVSPPLPRSQESPPRSPRVSVPIHDAADHPPLAKLDDVPVNHIEKWLDGTVSASGSLLADEDPNAQPSKPEVDSSPFAQTRADEEDLDEMGEKQFRDYMAANAPRRISISPIRQMRSSADRKLSSDDICAAF